MRHHDGLAARRDEPPHTHFSRRPQPPHDRATHRGRATGADTWSVTRSSLRRQGVAREPYRQVLLLGRRGVGLPGGREVHHRREARRRRRTTKRPQARLRALLIASADAASLAPDTVLGHSSRRLPRACQSEDRTSGRRRALRARPVATHETGHTDGRNAYPTPRLAAPRKPRSSCPGPWRAANRASCRRPSPPSPSSPTRSPSSATLFSSMTQQASTLRSRPSCARRSDATSTTRTPSTMTVRHHRRHHAGARCSPPSLNLGRHTLRDRTWRR